MDDLAIVMPTTKILQLIDMERLFHDLRAPESRRGKGSPLRGRRLPPQRNEALAPRKMGSSGSEGLVGNEAFELRQRLAGGTCQRRLMMVCEMALSVSMVLALAW